MQTEEVWKDIEGYECYQVSNLGRVRSIKNGTEYYLKLNVRESWGGSYKRLYVALSKNSIEKQYYVHRLVALAFPEICGDNFEGAEIDHLDGNATNNIATNLRFVTHFQNMNNPNFRKKHSNTMKGKKQSESQKAKIKSSMTNNEKTSKPLLQFDKEGNFIKEWPSAGECRRNGFTAAWNCATGKQKTCKGFIFRFKQKKAS